MLAIIDSLSKPFKLSPENYFTMVFGIYVQLIRLTLSFICLKIVENIDVETP
jgi:hypothetical protein